MCDIFSHSPFDFSLHKVLFNYCISLSYLNRAIYLHTLQSTLYCGVLLLFFLCDNKFSAFKVPLQFHIIFFSFQFFFRLLFDKRKSKSALIKVLDDLFPSTSSCSDRNQANGKGLAIRTEKKKWAAWYWTLWWHPLTRFVNVVRHFYSTVGWCLLSEHKKKISSKLIDHDKLIVQLAESEQEIEKTGTVSPYFSFSNTIKFVEFFFPKNV